MPPEATSARLVEKLLLLTHLISSAVDEGQIGELDVLFAERQSVLDQLSCMSLDPSAAAMMKLVLRAESSLKQKMQDDMADSVRHLQTLFQERRVHKAYARRVA